MKAQTPSPSRSPVVPALIVGGLLLTAGVANLIMIPHPVCFWFGGLLPQLPLAILGGRIGAGKTSGASGEY